MDNQERMEGITVMDENQVLKCKRTCERCDEWILCICRGEGSPNENIQTGAGWSCDKWEPRRMVPPKRRRMA